MYRAYLLTEQLRAAFHVKGQTDQELLAGWIAWARRSHLPGFVKLAKTMKRFQQLIWNTLTHQMSNAKSEATNTHLRALTKRSYGFHSPEALIAMARLTRGGLCPPLPGRQAPTQTSEDPKVIDENQYQEALNEMNESVSRLYDQILIDGLICRQNKRCRRHCHNPSGRIR